MLNSVKVLLAHGANPNMRLVKDLPQRHHDGYQLSRIGATPFFLAAAAGKAGVMRVLAAAGADTKLTTDKKTTPLIVAAGLGLRPGPAVEANHLNMLETLKTAFELGGDVNARGENGW